MKILENKIPPPLVALICGVFMWFVSDGLQNPLEFGFVRISALLAVCVIAAYFSISGLLAFRAARTTVNPLKPETASALVQSGVYRVSRNPMYVGFALLLLAWCLYLGSLLSFIGVLSFVFLSIVFRCCQKSAPCVHSLAQSLMSMQRKCAAGFSFSDHY